MSGIKTHVDVSVIIPALNVADTIGDQLAGLAVQDFIGHWEVIVADNGSTDSTLSVAQSFSTSLPSLRFVDATARRGVNHARNAGARASTAEMLLFCDGDDVVAPGWLAAMAEGLGSHDAVGGPLVALNGSGSGVVPDTPLRTGPFLPYPVGANCGVLRAVWLELGGFNEDYDGGAFDEVEFFWRLQLAGFTLVPAPDAFVRYRLPAKADLKKSFRHGRENVRLARDFRSSGYPGPSPGALRGWAWILSRVPAALFVPSSRSPWLSTVARRSGRVAGTIKYRHLAL